MCVLNCMYYKDTCWAEVRKKLRPIVLAGIEYACLKASVRQSVSQAVSRSVIQSAENFYK